MSRPFAARFAARMRTVAIGTALAVLLAGCSGDSPEKLMQSAEAYIAKSDHAAAAIQLKNLLQKQPENGRARLLLGRSLLETRDPASAEKELRRALEYGQPPDAVLPALARAMAEQNQHAKLLTEFGDRKVADPAGDAQFRTHLADALMRARRRDEAADAYAAALKQLPGHTPARLGQARIAASLGKIDEAVRITDEVIAARADHVEAHVLKADLLVASGNRAGAKDALRKAIEQKPADVGIRLALASLLLDEGALDAATTELAGARKAGRADLRVNYYDGLLALRKGDLPAAREQVQQVLKAAPEHVPSLVLAGAVELGTNQPLAAEAHLRKALARAPDHAGARRLLVGAYLKAGQSARALEMLQPLVSGQVEDPGLLLLAGETYLANGDMRQANAYFAAAAQVESVKAAARTRLGQIALAAGNFEQGISELESAAAMGNSPYQADLSLISGHLRGNAPDKALAAALNLEKKQPSNPVTHYVLGTVHLARKDAASARRSFNRALELQPLHVPSATMLANLDVAEKKNDAALKRFEAMSARDPKNDSVLLALADLQARLNTPHAEVGATLARAVAANPQSVTARVAVVNHQLRADDAKSAVRAAQEAVSAVPNEPRLLEVLGVAHELAGETEAALSTFNRLVSLQPGSPQPLQRLAGVHVRRKAYDQAVDALRRAQKIAPADRTIVRDIAAALAAGGRFDDAIRESRALQTRDPASGGGFVLEGDAYALQKKWPEAERAYRAGLKVDPGSDALAVRLHTALTNAGRNADAEAFVKRWSADNPKGTALRLYLADRAMRDKDLRAAWNHYQAVVTREPNHVVALNNLAWVSGELGDPKAVGYAEKAAKLAPNNAAVLDTLGMLLVKRGAANDGLVWLEKARLLAPARQDLRLNYAKALIGAGRKIDARKELEALQGAKEEFAGKDQIAGLLKSL